MEYIKNLIKKLEQKEVITYFCSEYGEPGYKNEKNSLILFGNWNKCTQKELEILENSDNYILEWEDEWVLSGDIAYRTEPNYLGWEKSYFIDEFGEVLGILDNPEDYLNMHINNPKKAIKSDFPIEKYGFKNLTDTCYQNGWYNKEDNPEKIYNKFKNNYKFLVFQICSVEQFAVNFKIYGK